MNPSSPRPALIGLDWGTTSLRAYLMDRSGQLLARKSAPLGIMKIERGGFSAAFDAVAGGWRDERPGLPAIAAGMIGSAQGWIEAPYLTCPVGPAELAGALTPVPERHLLVAPGVRQTDPSPDVMRGEETQIAGALALYPELAFGSRLVLPGTHSKWVSMVDGRISHFTTFMTGELFSVLRDHSILGRFARGEAAVLESGGEAFLRGVDAARAAHGIAPLLFSARALVLAGKLPPEDSLHFLSGLLIGDELSSALPGADPPSVLIGDPALCVRYTLAFARFSLPIGVQLEDAAASGLWRIAVAAGLVEGGPREDL